MLKVSLQNYWEKQKGILTCYSRRDDFDHTGIKKPPVAEVLKYGSPMSLASRKRVVLKACTFAWMVFHRHNQRLKTGR